MKQSNLGQENSNIESANEKDKEDVVFAEDSALNTAVGNDGGDIPGPANKKRHGCVTTWLVLIFIASAYSVLANLAMGFYYPWNIYVMLSIGQLVCVILMFNWKLNGFWGFAIIQLPATFLNISLGLPASAIIGGLLAPFILYFILQIKRNNISAWDQLD